MCIAPSSSGVISVTRCSVPVGLNTAMLSTLPLLRNVSRVPREAAEIFSAPAAARNSRAKRALHKKAGRKARFFTFHYLYLRLRAASDFFLRFTEGFS